MGTELKADSIDLPTDLVSRYTPAPREEDEPQSLDVLQALSAKASALAGAVNTLVGLPERKREEALRDSEVRLSAELAAAQQLQRISVELIHEQDVQSLYTKLVDAAAYIMRSDCASMQTLHPERGDKGELRLLAVRGFSPQAIKFWEWVRADSGCTCGMALRTRERAIATDVETCDFIAGTQHLATYLQAGIHAVQSTPLLSRSGRLVGMLSTHWREPHEPSETELQRFDVLARQAADLIERAQAETALRESEERYRTLFASAPMALFVCDRNAVIQDYNDRATELWGREPVRGVEQYSGSVSLWLPNGAPLQHAQSPIAQVLRTGIPVFNAEVFIERPDGSRLPVVVNFAALRDARGEITGAITSFIDITERRRAEEQRKLLLREMNHRIKNLFALAGGVVTLSARSAETPKDLAKAVSERLAALARAHELTLPGVTGEKADRPATLPVLVRAIISPFLVEKERVIINGPEVPISGNAVTSLALLLQEFATNAAKYGALSNENGRVEVSWCEWKGELLLAWREEGGPSIYGPPKSEDEGFGSTLARLTVTGQLGGKISRDWDKEGLTVKLSVPLDRLAYRDRDGPSS